MPSFKIAWLFILLSSSFPLPLAHAQDLKSAADSKPWLRLGHYHRRFLGLGGYKSKVDSKDFFLAPDGATNPEAELAATIRGFSNPNAVAGFRKQPVRCVFPQRLEFVRQAFPELGVPALKKNECPAYDDWLSQLQASALSLIYVTAYPNNPASMFGHTFLRLQQEQGIRDYGINFSAEVPKDENSVLFAMNGLFGGYTGYFSMAQYYTKLNEYNDLENRELWEYKLAFNPEEIQRLLRHLWELLMSAHFKYYFLDDNCSYFILSLLEAAKPEWDLTDKLGWKIKQYVLPADTVKSVLRHSPESANSVHYRPSIKREHLAHVEALTSKQKRAFENYLDDRSALTEIKDPQVLDTISSYYHFKKYRNPDDPSVSDEMRSFLMQRSKIKTVAHSEAKARDPMPDVTTRPDLGHDPASLGFGAFAASGRSRGVLLKYRLSLHDFLNADPGYLPYSEVRAFEPEMAYDFTEKKFSLREATLLRMASLFPFETLDFKLSWTVSGRVFQTKELRCRTCPGYEFEAGAGSAIAFLNKNVLAYGLAFANFQYSAHFEKEWRMGLGPELGLVASIGDRLKTKASGRWITDFFRNYGSFSRAEFEASQSVTAARDLEFRVASQYLPAVFEGQRRWADLRFYALVFF